jgi:hypothetical protein
MPLDGDKSDETGDGDEPVVVPARRGRRPGSKNRRTIECEIALRPMLPRARRKLTELLGSSDPEMALRATTLLFAYVYGRPTERREVTGVDGAPLVPPAEPLDYMEAARRIGFLLVAGREQARVAGGPMLEVIQGDAEHVEPPMPQPEPAFAPTPPTPRPNLTFEPPPPVDQTVIEERLASENEAFAFERQRHPRHVVITKRNR